jgi:hypothetical protein
MPVRSVPRGSAGSRRSCRWERWVRRDLLGGLRDARVVHARPGDAGPDRRRPGHPPAPDGLEQEQQGSGQQQQQRGDERRAEGLLDRVLEEEAHDRHRDARRHDQQPHPPVRQALAAAVQAEEAAHDRLQLAAEVHEDRTERPEVQEHVEGQPALAEAEGEGDEDEVAGARDGDELGQALHDADQQRLQPGGEHGARG